MLITCVGEIVMDFLKDSSMLLVLFLVVTNGTIGITNMAGQMVLIEITVWSVLQLVVRIIHSTQAITVVMVLIMKDLLMVTSTMVTISLVLVKNGMMVLVVLHLVLLIRTVMFVLLLLLLIVGIKELL